MHACPRLREADAADAHAVACILALALWEAGEAGRPATETTGLAGDELCALAGEFFPQAGAMFAGLRGRPAPGHGVDEACLRDLLRARHQRGHAYWSCGWPT